MSIGPNSAEIWEEFRTNLSRARKALEDVDAERKFYALPFELRALCYSVADRWQAPGHHDHEVMAQDVGIAIDAALSLSSPHPTAQPEDEEE